MAEIKRKLTISLVKLFLNSIKIDQLLKFQESSRISRRKASTAKISSLLPQRFRLYVDESDS